MSTAPEWLLLIHQIPPKPGYLRVKIWRRLQRLGAAALKNSVYVLPKNAETMEDFQWVRREIEAGGAEASICEAKFLEGISNPQVEALFHAARDADYGEIAREATRVVRSRGVDVEQRLRQIARLRKRFDDVTTIDFFGAPGREAAEGLLGKAEQTLLGGEESHVETEKKTEQPRPRGRTWVTRTGIRVDRIGSAWLIRRFIDPDGAFKFVPAKGYQTEPGELRFDMFDAEYTHEGDRCTFEVLLKRFGLHDRALLPIAEIIHDLDFKDDKFDRDETSGIAQVLAGLYAAEEDDARRLARGSDIFESLYQSFKRRRSRRPHPSPRGNGDDNRAAACRELHGDGRPVPPRQLVRYFLELGTFGFGGPIALAGYMQRDLVERRRWIAQSDYVEGLALAQLAPGPLAAQLAIYLGLLHGRVVGATLVGLAFVLPSFLMVLALSALYLRFGGLA